MPFMNNIYLLPNFLHFAMLLSAAALRDAYASVRVPPTRSGVTACAVGAGAHLRSAYRWMADDGVRQPPEDGCIIVAPGWLAYLGLVVERKKKI